MSDTNSKNREVFISIDIESSGPVPGIYSLLSIGACRIDNPHIQFYVELKPDGIKCDPEALAVTGFDLDDLEKNGTDPKEAMLLLKTWLFVNVRDEERAIFTGLNAPFDWSFVNYYFHKYLGKNPFGFTALDMKAYFMGASKCAWNKTAGKEMCKVLKPITKGNHNALDDAIHQAELFRLMLIMSDIKEVSC